MGQKDYIEKHGIKTVRSEIIRPHFNDEAFTVPEYNNIVVETNTMSREMWVRATAFYYMVKALHGNGFLRAFAIYIFNELGIPYEKFYDGAMDYFEKSAALNVNLGNMDAARSDLESARTIGAALGDSETVERLDALFNLFIGKVICLNKRS